MPDYDRADAESIFEYSRRILGKTLRECVGENLSRSRKGKGGLGQLVEECFFGYAVNGRQEADFAEANLELKCTPLKKNAKGGLCIKERLVCTMIDFSEVAETNFDDSRFLLKCRLLLLLFYLHVSGRALVDLKFLYSVLWTLPEKDLLIIRHDYEVIRGKILAGRAHEISEGDTEYLGACRKGAGGEKEKKVPQPNSSVPAFRRAFALKTAYMRTILDFVEKSGTNAATNFSPRASAEAVSVEELKEKSFEEIILERFSAFIGKSAREISEAKGISYNPQNKGRYARAASAVITTEVGNVNQSEEFRKSGIELKTVRLSRTGRPKEALPFENINYHEVWETRDEGWPASRWYEICTGRFLFAVFRETDATEISYGNFVPVCVLEKVFFWTMPPKDLKVAEEFWLDILRNIESRTTASTRNNFWKERDDRNFHVRPKAKDAADKTSTPFEAETSKMCCWFNHAYVKAIVDAN